ncbi:HEPN domain-containing protein [[Clostridium] innocuum]|nr:HEPN domain-containing protein [[Clostridium] innocuum]
MTEYNKIEINVAIFPKIMTIALGKPIKKNAENSVVQMSSLDNSEPDIIIDLPRGAYLLYLQKIVSEKNEVETKLLKQYAYGIQFSDEDIECVLDIIMTDTDRKWTQSIQQGDFLSPFGVGVSNDGEGNQKFVLLDEAIPTIRVETWESILSDLLKKQAFDIIECFDFASSFNTEDNNELHFSLGAWKFSANTEEQSLSNALRSAFMFTLIGYYFGDDKTKYDSFHDFFDSEFYKRVSLLYGLWTARSQGESIRYVSLYESFYNLSGIEKNHLIKVIKAVLDNENVALDEKQTLKNQLIEGAGIFHNNPDTAASALEESLIKPAVNFVLLREKAKDTLESSQILCDEGKYSDCADRCYYAMMFTLKALLENRGKLAGWKTNELKERESHGSLEIGLQELVSENVLLPVEESEFEYVKDKRWKCDYSLYKFEKTDAETCINKAQEFYNKMETLTV